MTNGTKPRGTNVTNRTILITGAHVRIGGSENDCVNPDAFGGQKRGMTGSC